MKKFIRCIIFFASILLYGQVVKSNYIGVYSLLSQEHLGSNAEEYFENIYFNGGNEPKEETSRTCIEETSQCILSCDATVSPINPNNPLEIRFKAIISTIGCIDTPQYFWDFGDGTSSTGDLVDHTYSQPGVYTWYLIVTVNNQQCKREGTITILPNMSLTCDAIVISSVCNGFGVKYSAQAWSIGCTATPQYFWDFGDGTTGIGQQVSHIYTSPGTYIWTLTVKACECVSTESGEITVISGCSLECDASITPTSGSSPLAVNFSALIGGCPVMTNVCWVFGDGTAGCGQEVEHIYTSPGTYTWSMNVSACGQSCTKSGVVKVDSESLLMCNIKDVPTTGCAPMTVQFSATAWASGCTENPQYSWNFGDGTTGSGSYVTHNYSSPGTYTWTLTVEACGQKCTKVGTIVISDCSIECDAQVSTTSGSAPLTVTFSATATASGCNETPQYLWNFGDGTTGNGQQVSHTYTSPGTYTWTLTVVACGSRCVKSGTIRVVSECSVECSATAIPTTGCVPLTVNFSAIATVTGCNGTPQYYWEFGDGTSGNGQNVSHTYTQPGTYTWISVVLVDNKRCVNSGTITVTECDLLECDATVTATSGSPPLTVTFSATVSGCNDTPQYLWNFGDGTTGNGQQVSHTYTSPGTYTWHLTVEACGQKCTKSGTITVTSGWILTCDAYVFPTTIGCPPLPVLFTATASAAGCLISPNYYWDFGDGQNGSGQQVGHIYTQPGTYTWTLTVQACEQECTETGTITVLSKEECQIACEVKIDHTEGCAPLTVNFSGMAFLDECEEVPQYYWYFGDGTNIESGQNVTHTYSQPGTYTWIFMVVACGQTCTRTGTITVVSSPCSFECRANVILSNNCAPATATFLAYAYLPIGCDETPQYYWDFGDGTAGSGAWVNHTYISAGTYTWTLTVSACGQSCMTSGVVIVDSGEGCSLNCKARVYRLSPYMWKTFNFVASISTSGCNGVPQFFWNFGDGTWGYGQNVIHTYSNSGTYTWTLTVKVGCKECTVSGKVFAGIIIDSTTLSIESINMNPIKLVIKGINFQRGCIVKINNLVVPKTVWKNENKVVVKGGSELKRMIPKGKTVYIKVVNPNGAESNEYAFTR